MSRGPAAVAYNAFELGGRHRFPNGEASCIGVVRYVDRVVFIFKMLQLRGLYQYRTLVSRGVSPPTESDDETSQ
jgi:hypothetical protein